MPIKRALVIRNVASSALPLDSLDNALVQACTSKGFLTEVAVLHDHEIRDQLLQPTTSSAFASASASFPSPHAGASFEAVLFRASGVPASRLLSIIKMIRTISKQVFLCVLSASLIEDPNGRYQCFRAGASMVTNALDDVHQIMAFIASCDAEASHANHSLATGYRCPFCDRAGLQEDQLWRHCPLYHINEPNRNDIVCPICRQSTQGTPFQVHLHNAHGPPRRGEMPSEFTMGDTLLYAFALVVCRNPKYNRYLLVQEFANSGFWLPGGRIDSGENPIEAAIRETQEEAGIAIRITGLLKIEYHPKRDRQGHCYVRERFIFSAEPLDCEQLPKSIPDYESVGATWCKWDEVETLQLRGPEPRIYFAYMNEGKPVYPIEMMHISSVPMLPSRKHG